MSVALELPNDPPAIDPPANDPQVTPAVVDPPVAVDPAVTPPADPVDPPADKPAALPDNWRELIAGDNKDKLTLLKRYGSMDGVVKALQEKEAFIRSGKIKRDMPDPKDEKAMGEWRKEQGIPDDPTGYVIPEPIVKRLVDEDKPILSSFTEFAHGKNAPPAFVEMAAEWYVNMSESAAEMQSQKDDSAREEAEDALRSDWARDEYKPNLTLAKRYWDSFGIEGLAEARLADGRKLGNIAEFIKQSSDKGRETFGDVVFSSGDAETRHNNRKAEIDKIRTTDFDRYESEGLDKEYRTIIETELKRGKR
jgi:hypothetical protein